MLSKKNKDTLLYSWLTALFTVGHSQIKKRGQMEQNPRKRSCKAKCLEEKAYLLPNSLKNFHTLSLVFTPLPGGGAEDDIQWIKDELVEGWLLDSEPHLKGDVALLMHARSKVYKLERLSIDDSWSLFCKKAFWLEDGHTCPVELEEEGRLIVQDYVGLPLSIVVVGGMMSQRACSIPDWFDVRQILAWELNNHEAVRGILTLSYKDLPSLLKYCFLYCC
ncbi:hypothetical protein AMTR_s00039p00121770 [Amborella trichopoda]|uniref:Uncharacterized protein n=1 Tax=Amborella trichopoda TaxID=13333 RepID=U5D034_AMBTC|nr:hypothetical protein AMTR_s00039p00121770 [Amborella trichopoda]